jgi:hypothetical protein
MNNLYLVMINRINLKNRQTFTLAQIISKSESSQNCKAYILFLVKNYDTDYTRKIGLNSIDCGSTWHDWIADYCYNLSPKAG